VKLTIDNHVKFQLPRNWSVLSDNGVTTLNSIIESAVFNAKDLKFQANLRNDNGETITTVQTYKWNSEFTQDNVSAMTKTDLNGYDKDMHRQMKKEIAQVGGSFSDWLGTKTQRINGLTILSSKYRRVSKHQPQDHFIVQVLRIYSGSESFSFVISYHEESTLPLSILVEKIISTLGCKTCS